MTNYLGERPSLESCWRGVILFGSNSASYKFALAKALMKLAGGEPSFVPLSELAVPFAEEITSHLQKNDRQGTSQNSRFLDACREFNAGSLSKTDLVDKTVALGFNNVLDAFHRVNLGELPVRFFQTESNGRVKGIRLTDDLLRLKDGFQNRNLPLEVDARWRLVETAWELGISSGLLQIQYDDDDGTLFIEPSDHRRVAVTSCRPALNGYQKGKCFYCFTDIAVDGSIGHQADVDHLLPYVLGRQDPNLNLNGVWNLVLACSRCNRGDGGKFARVPTQRYLERLSRRNDFLISSHHPLRETLIAQTGSTEQERREYLTSRWRYATAMLIQQWVPLHEEAEAF